MTGDESELAQASPATVDVVVEGPMSQVRGLDRKSIDVYIDPDDIPFGQRRRKEVVAETPVGSDVMIVQLTPKTLCFSLAETTTQAFRGRWSRSRARASRV